MTMWAMSWKQVLALHAARLRRSLSLADARTATLEGEKRALSAENSRLHARMQDQERDHGDLMRRAKRFYQRELAEYVDQLKCQHEMDAAENQATLTRERERDRKAYADAKSRLGAIAAAGHLRCSLCRTSDATHVLSPCGHVACDVCARGFTKAPAPLPNNPVPAGAAVSFADPAAPPVEPAVELCLSCQQPIVLRVRIRI